MAYYAITIRPSDEDDIPMGAKPEVETYQVISVPRPIVDLFEVDSEGVTIDTAILTFSDGTQVVWGTTD